MSEETFNVTRAIDQGSGNSLLIQVATLSASIAFLDGVDTTSISIAAPRIADQLALSHWQLGPVFSSAVLGAMIGALSFGSLADRFGRRSMLILTTVLFGVGTLLTAAAGSFYWLLLVRFLTGIGLGGASPCFIALASEYAPKAKRARVTGLIWTAFSLGTVLGTFLAAYLVSKHGWRSIFVVGGVAPLVVTIALLIWLPESLQFLLAKGRRPAAVRRIARRIAPRLGDNVRCVVDATIIKGTPFASLFSDGRIAETLLIWVGFAAAFGVTGAIFFWAPTLMRDHGIPLSRGAIILGVSGIGSLLGAGSSGFLMTRFKPVTVLVAAFCFGAIAVALVGVAANATAMIALDLLFTGFLVAGLSASGMLVLAAGVYPMVMRSTGVGSAMGLGRFGQVVMPLVTSAVLLIGFRSSDVFPILGAVMLMGAMAIFTLRRHRGGSVATATV